MDADPKPSETLPVDLREERRRAKAELAEMRRIRTQLNRQSSVRLAQEIAGASRVMLERFKAGEVTPQEMMLFARFQAQAMSQDAEVARDLFPEEATVERPAKVEFQLTIRDPRPAALPEAETVELPTMPEDSSPEEPGDENAATVTPIDRARRALTAIGQRR